jgi:hypothetical protein
VWSRSQRILRPEGDGRQRTFLKIVAGLIGVGFDDLYQREKRRAQWRKMLGGASAAAALLIVLATWWSIARLGKSQTEVGQELASVGAESKVSTMDYKDVRPTSKEAEHRIRALAAQAEKALAANLPDKTYEINYQYAARAVVAVVQYVRTIEEGVFSVELQKLLLARLTAVGTAVSKETFRRTNEQVRRVTEEANRKSKAMRRKP